MDILNYIKQHYSHFNFTEKELSVLGEFIIVHQFKRNELFLKQNTPCNKMGLLIKGTAYSYKTNDQGEKIIQDFFYPDRQDVLFDYESYIQNKNSCLNIEFQEDVIVSYFYIEDIKKLYIQFPRLLQFELLIIQQEFLYSIERSELLQLKSAEEKIKLLQKNNPKIFELYSYINIASYLGIHRNTFRRVFSKQ